jgi:phosphate transport system protein
MSLQITGHIVNRFDSEMINIHTMVMAMGELAQDQLLKVLALLDAMNVEAAREVVANDAAVDDLEVKTDDEILRVIAKRGPVARDLRALVAMSKSVTDLERIGDEVEKICKLLIQLYDTDNNTPGDNLLRDIRRMGKAAMELLSGVMDVYKTMDSARAKDIVRGHSDMDEYFRADLRRLLTFVLEDSRNVGHTVKIVLIIKAFERIGDHVKNIAEQVIYFAEGEDVRHKFPKGEAV